jgi:hypothetical protein
VGCLRRGFTPLLLSGRRGKFSSFSWNLIFANEHIPLLSHTAAHDIAGKRTTLCRYSPVIVATIRGHGIESNQTSFARVPTANGSIEFKLLIITGSFAATLPSLRSQTVLGCCAHPATAPVEVDASSGDPTGDR